MGIEMSICPSCNSSSIKKSPGSGSHYQRGDCKNCGKFFWIPKPCAHCGFQQKKIKEWRSNKYIFLCPHCKAEINENVHKGVEHGLFF